MAFADAVASDHTAISDAQVRVLFDEFTLPEIVELLVLDQLRIRRSVVRLSDRR